MDKTNVIPFGKSFNPGNKLCHDLEVNWTNDFKLLGLGIDNKLELMGQNFEKAHTKAQNIISDWKAHKLPINGTITISKCLIIIQFNYVASILKPSSNQLIKSQNMINNFVRDSDHHWISDQKLYTPTRKGGLNCNEIPSLWGFK